jgi:hypothetical protein
MTDAFANISYRAELAYRLRTGMSVMVESANVVPDSVRDGHHAEALCTDVPWS